MRTPLLPCFAALCLVVILLHHMISTVAGNYTPVDQILLNCGFSGNSTASDARIWIGDVNSKFLTHEQSQSQSSLTSTVKEAPNVPQVPFTDARLSLAPFTYVFPVTAGQKFVRLYFYPASYSNFDRSNALFSVKVGGFTLLSNFNASLNADAGSGPTISREYCVNIEEDQRLNITFTPSSNVSNSYAFINGIEILSMPTNLYYTPADDQGFDFIGQQNQYRIENSTSLEMVYRLNVGGKTISSADDTGMFRGWQDDFSYLKEYRTLFLPFNNTIKLKFTVIPQYTAPEDVYRTARTLGNDSTINLSYNLTWQFPVDSGFDYLIRLHFCEFQPEIIQASDRIFHIFIANQTTDEAADVILWSGGNGVPVYKDYAVSMRAGTEKKVNLYVAIGAEPQSTSYVDAILNGVEIFKVSDYNGNLAGPNPDPLPPNPPTIAPPVQAKSSKGNKTTIFAAAAGGVAGFILLSILGFLILRRGKRVKDSGSSDGTSWWGPFSFTTTKSTKTRKSSLPSALSRYFSLAEIKAATNNFDDTFIIGVGGFGNVYKGFIDGGDRPVAIKRLVPGSQQGVHEFETEIELLSQLRHLHLVSLIGYCNDGMEMILVYDYMARGTLRDHLYKSNNPPLSWKQRLQICIGAARGLSYLHTDAKQTIIHRDVKTTNILLDEEWVAKVSDFGLSRTGPTGVSKAHVSTVVKGSFGYLDPEYYRRQQLTEKSDVYSFGVVLFEVLSARPPILKTAEKKQVSLAEWARQSSRNGKFDQIVDPTLKGQIATECLNKFGEVAVSCLHDSGVERPSMNDVVWGLEFALQLQESIEKVGKPDHVVELEMNDAEKALLPQSKSDDSNNMFSSSGGQVSSIYSNSEVTMTSSGDQQSFSSTYKDSDRLVSSGAVFSEIMNPQGR
ncbi:receptor-like protein kinase FERONIA [Juglans microcarpa x Juglans regia]|uniref:receptor-like protein kinase FERONIA n=1 Tax=Juglans microcarpa x Juglans regia TaxID=2249226 RepID=UPI001B7E1743|nr:receptor-like protein kinase FERONIA [Juglans microcarpa x Juglans regia]